MADPRHQVEQGRAHRALSFVQESVDESAEVASRYRAYVKNLPMLIKTNGLGSAMAFVKAKAQDSPPEGTAYDLLYAHVEQWLQSDQKKHLLASAEADTDDLVEQLVTMDSSTYRAVTMEVMNLLNWLRRLADGMTDADE
jgi:CRISPR-associated protein Cmr5